MGELARKPGAPTVAETPLELLTPREGDGFTFINKYGMPLSAVGVGFAGMSLYNIGSKRPFWAGIHQHIFVASALGILAHFVNLSRLEHYKEKDATYRHYIMLHPEEFPPFDRKRFKDIFLPWTPIR